MWPGDLYVAKRYECGRSIIQEQDQAEYNLIYNGTPTGINMQPGWPWSCGVCIVQYKSWSWTRRVNMHSSFQFLSPGWTLEHSHCIRVTSKTLCRTPMSEWHFCKCFLNLHQCICNIIIQCFKNNHFWLKGVLHDYWNIYLYKLLSYGQLIMG